MKSQISARARVIEAAVHLEANITLYLCTYLNIDIKKSILFGFKRGCLSFENKLSLLFELKYLNAEKREKFKQFSEIRNKFAHMSTVINFTDCYNSLSGAENRLKKWFPMIYNKLNGEDRNRELYVALKEELFEDLLDFQSTLAESEKHEATINYHLAYALQIDEIMNDAGSTNKTLKKSLSKIKIQAKRNARAFASAGINVLETKANK